VNLAGTKGNRSKGELWPRGYEATKTHAMTRLFFSGGKRLLAAKRGRTKKCLAKEYRGIVFGLFLIRARIKRPQAREHCGENSEQHPRLRAHRAAAYFPAGGKLLYAISSHYSPASVARRSRVSSRKTLGAFCPNSTLKTEREL